MSWVQYCRVPKNGQAGISSINKNDPRLDSEVFMMFLVKATSEHLSCSLSLKSVACACDVDFEDCER